MVVADINAEWARRSPTGPAAWAWAATSAIRPRSPRWSAPRVTRSARDCAEAKVGAVVVVTAGCPGDAAAGHATGHEITRFVRSHGMRTVGPTSMGVLSAHAGSVMHATFAPVRPPAGAVAMSSQSGPLGLAILDLARRTGLGFSCSVSIGAAADVSSNDLLEWWEDDPQTGVVLLYLENFGNPPNFARIARRVGARKPVVAVTPGSDPASGALLAQAGVIHAATLDEMFDVALLLANQPVPAGNRVAIVTNALAPGVLAAAACADGGLTVTPLSPPMLGRLLAAGLSPTRAPGAVDLRPTASPDDYLAALSAVLADPAVDSVIVIFMPPLVRAVREVAAAIKQAVGGAPGKPVVTSFMSSSGLPPQLRDGGQAIPSYVFRSGPRRRSGGRRPTAGGDGSRPECWSIRRASTGRRRANCTSLRAYPLLTGVSGADPADLPAVEEALLRLSALVEDWPVVAEVVIGTLLIGRAGEGVTAVASAVRLGNPAIP